jgi:beta-lactamase regulating signal transducer with metallopeptidase domain
MSLTLGLLTGAAVKATVILALAGLITALWRTASASTRHLVWTIAVASAFVLPFAAAGIALIGTPRLAVPFEMPVARIAVDIAPAESLAPLGPLESVEAPPASDLTASPLTNESSVESEVVEPASRVNAEIELPALAAMATSSIFDGILSNWQAKAALLWAIGALLALIPLGFALVRVRMIARNARPTRDPRWLRLIEESPSIRHLATRVRVLESRDASMPMTWGILSPTLLVPLSAADWPEWKCRNILLHELAHVERRDCLTQLLAQFTCALYWFHPLAWVAAHRMQVEREVACDDCVIAAGSQASDYAANLLEVARSLRAPSFTSQTAIAMARPSQLSGRLLAVLDARRNRAGVSRSLFTAATLAAVVLVVVLASLTTRAAIATAAEAPPTAAPVVPMNDAAPYDASSSEYLPVPISIVQATQIPAVGLVPSAATAVMGVSAPAALASRELPALSFTSSASQSCWTDEGGSDKGENVSIHTNSDDAREIWQVKYSRRDCSLELRAEGKFTLRPDLSDLQSLSREGFFRVEEREGRNSRRVEIRTASNGGLEHSYWVNGDRRPFDEDGRRWLAATLLSVERRTAFAADTRVPQLYRSGGLRLVLSEIALMPSAYAKSKYYGSLLEMEGTLDANTLSQVVQRVVVDMRSSDYYMAEVLGKLSSQRAMNESTWRTFAEAAGRMGSDYYKAQVLKKVLNSGRLSNETVAVLLRSGAGIKSDYYLSDVLKSVAAKYPVTDATRSIYAEALGKIESDYYRASLLKSMQSSDAWDARTSSFVLASVSDMKSDYYKSQSLISLVQQKHVPNWNAFFGAVGTMESEHYRRETLNAALNHDPLTKEIVSGILSAASRMRSDHETAQVLSTVARKYTLDSDLRAAYERAVDSIDSEHYRGTALVALRRNQASR